MGRHHDADEDYLIQVHPNRSTGRMVAFESDTQARTAIVLVDAVTNANKLETSGKGGSTFFVAQFQM